MAGGSSSAGLVSPMQGTVVKIAVEEGAKVEVGDLIIVLEAMKMEQPLTAHKAGVISNLTAVIGATVSSGTNLCDIPDAARPTTARFIPDGPGRIGPRKPAVPN